MLKRRSVAMNHLLQSPDGAYRSIHLCEYSIQLCFVRLSDYLLPSGHAALHPDETSIAVVNQNSGVDVWRIPCAILKFSFPVEMTKGVLIPVAWIDEGARILTGSDTGKVRIWNTLTQNSLHPLPHRKSICPKHYWRTKNPAQRTKSFARWR